MPVSGDGKVGVGIGTRVPVAVGAPGEHLPGVLHRNFGQNEVVYGFSAFVPQDSGKAVVGDVLVGRFRPELLPARIAVLVIVLDILLE
jgi:hypothetical protein